MKTKIVTGMNSPVKSTAVHNEQKDGKSRNYVCLFKITRTLDNILFSHMIVMVETSILHKWKATIEKKDEKRKTIYVSFPFLIAADTIRNHLSNQGMSTFLNIEWFNEVPSEESLLKCEALVKKYRKKEEKRNIISFFKFSVFEKNTSLLEMRVALQNSVMQKWYSRIEKESDILRQIFISVPRLLKLSSVVNCLQSNNLTNFLKVELIENLTSDEDLHRFEILVKEKISQKDDV